MGFEKRLVELVETRYDHEVARSDRGDNLRLYYFGFLGAIISWYVSAVASHGIVFTGITDVFYWIAAIVVVVGVLWTVFHLVKAIWPSQIAYMPLPKDLSDYAESCREYQRQSGTAETSLDHLVEKSLDIAWIHLTSDVVNHNHLVNNRKQQATTRGFFGLVVTGLAVAIMTAVSLFIDQEKSLKVEQPIQVEIMSKPSTPPPAQPTPQSNANRPGSITPKPPEPPKMILLTEGREASVQNHKVALDSPTQSSQQK
jgi:hypothetical protein